MTLRRAGLAILALLVAALGAFAWRLDRGPIAVGFLAERIEVALNGDGPPRVEIGAARIGWEGWDGAGLAPLDILLAEVRVLDASGSARIEVPEAKLALPLGGLLRGELAPRMAELRDPILRLHRTADGGVSLGLGAPAGAGSAEGWPAMLADPPAGSPLAALDHLAVLDGRVVVEDRQLRQDWTLRDLFVVLDRRAGGEVEGQASGELALGGETVPLRLTARIAAEPPVAQLTLSVPQVNPGRLARAAPALGPLGLLDAPAALSARASFDAAGRPLAMTAELEAGPGALDPSGMGSVPFTALQVGLSAEPDRLRLERLTLRLAPAEEAATAAQGPTLTATGLATRDGAGWQGEAQLSLDRARLDRLDSWWPRGAAAAARGWVTENLAAGLLRDGHWQVGARGPASLDRVEVTALSGRAALDDVGVRWLTRLPPLEGLSGSANFGLDGITLHVEGGRQAGTELRLPEGRLRLTGLGAGPARAELRGRVTGPVSDLWALLRDPQLGLLAGRDLPVRDPTGSLDAELAGTLPLSAASDDPTFRVTARLSGLRLPDLVLGRSLTDGEFEVVLDRAALQAEGTGRFADIPLRATLSLDFPDAPAEEPALSVTASAQVAAARLAEFGVDPGEALEGPVGLDLRYETRGGLPARLAVVADLEAARLSLPPLGYTKPAGVAGRAEAVLRLEDGALRAVESLHAEAPSLLLRARTAEEDGIAAPLEILEGRIGETRFVGTVRPPAAAGEAWDIALRGPVIDLRPVLEQARAGGLSTDAAAAGGAMPPLTFEARFDRALTPEPGPPLRELAASAALGGGTGLREARIAGQVGEADPAAFAATVTSPEGGRAVRVQAADTGALLAALGLPSPITGGRLDLAATQPPGAPMEGTAELADFAVRDAPAIGRLLQALTGYGLLEALSGPGLGFSRMTLPFRLTPGMLVIEEARAFSASLGVTAEGGIDLRQRTLDIEGTIVPAYVFNALLGHLPLVGGLFSAEQGGGLFSAGFEVEGPIGDPRISVNPLTALTPGFLRGLFDLDEQEPGAAPDGLR